MGRNPARRNQVLADAPVDVAGVAEYERAMFQGCQIALRYAFLCVSGRVRDHVHPHGSRHDELHLLLVEVEQFHAGNRMGEVRDGKVDLAVRQSPGLRLVHAFDQFDGDAGAPVLERGDDARHDGPPPRMADRHAQHAGLVVGYIVELLHHHGVLALEHGGVAQERLAA